MNYEKWEQLYILAATEADGEKMPERVDAAREAIRGRLQELEQSDDHHVERKQLKTTLERLGVLEGEARTWVVRPQAKRVA